MPCYPFFLMLFLDVINSTNQQNSIQANEKHVKFPGKLWSMFSLESMKDMAQGFSVYKTKLLIIS